MKKIYSFAGHALVVTALSFAPVAAQSPSSQSGSTPGTRTQGSTADGPQGTQPSSGSTGQQDRERDKVTSYGAKVGEDVPAQGTQTDQRGRTAADGARAAGDAGALKGADRAFLLDAIQGNRAEVELAELAEQKATSEAVRQLAQALQEQHEQANTTLKAIAASVGAASNDPELAPKHRELQDRLSRLEGEAFDRAYAVEMVKDHEKDIKTYEKASRQLQHPELKAYATETLPKLKRHLEMARQAQATAPRTR